MSSSTRRRRPSDALWTARVVEWPLPEGIVPRDVTVANGWIVAITASSTLTRWNVRRGGAVEQYPVPSNAKLAHVFCDPTAAHTLISAVNGDLFYFHSSAKAVLKLPGFGPDSNILSYISAVAWDRERGTETSTQNIVLGTVQGELYEFSLHATTSTADASPTVPPLRLFSSSSQGGGQVTGLWLERLQSSGVLLIVVTAGRGQPTRLITYATSHNSSLRHLQNSSILELPGGLAWAELCVCGTQIGVRTASGLYFAQLDRSGTSTSQDHLVEAGLWPWNTQPLSLAITPHHWVTLTYTHQQQPVLEFINRVSQTVVQTERLEGGGGLETNQKGALCTDVRRPDQIWFHQGRTLVHISSSQEDRDVWKFTLQKCLAQTDASDDHEALFEQAKTLCTNNSQKAVVTTARAEYHWRHGRPALAAKYWAQCPPQLKPFGETALRLALPPLGLDDVTNNVTNNVPLMTYLTDKMRLAKLQDDKMTCTMLGAWLTELYLFERQDVTTMLQSHVDHLDAKTILKILTSHDVRASDSAPYAVQSGDLATAVPAALVTGGAREALSLLHRAPIEVAEPLYYKYAHVFLAQAPSDAGDAFLARYRQGLSPMKLLPFFMQYEKLREEKARMRATEAKTDESYKIKIHEDDVSSRSGFELRIGGSLESFVDDNQVSVRYLEGVIQQGCRSSAVYSYLVSLYARMVDEEPLYKFLTTHIPEASTVVEASQKALLSKRHATDELLSSPLDLGDVLRVVLGTGRHFRSAIKLYMGFGLRQQAVELALKVDPTLARTLAQESVDINERRRLWLMIAKNAANDGSSRGGKDVVSRVVSVLKDCGPDVLSIEDVLPFLPDFAQIDQIKDEICEALTGYSTKIDSFLQEMNECDKMCEDLREEVGQLRRHHMRVKTDARCALSNKPIIGAGEPFYVFPSGYVFLASALKKEVLPYLNERQKTRVEEIEKELDSTPLSASVRNMLQTELDGLIAAECPFTGSMMVESIDHDFEDGTEIGENGGIYRSEPAERAIV